jgi:hypothetical protein
MKGRRRDVERLRVEPGVQVTWHARAQQGFPGPHSVRHPCRHGRRDGLPLLGRSSPLTLLRRRESHALLPGPASRESIAALRRTHRRTPSPDDRGGWRTPERHPEVNRLPCLKSVQRAYARCAYCIHALEGHHPPVQGNRSARPGTAQGCLAAPPWAASTKSRMPCSGTFTQSGRLLSSYRSS